ncbi:MAG TPA: sigma-70 family RNA polymerase sigma factor [Gammaproteobacteria bacterium]|jgi:RNA polymerase sigma-70 factor (ECF subfamily)
MPSSTAISGGATATPVGRPARAILEEQFTRLLTGNRAALSRLAASYTRTAGDCDDLLQEIAMALWRALPAFRGECSERTFVFRIAHNRCITHLSKRRVNVSLDEAEIEVEDPSANAEAALAEEQERQRLLAAIRDLPAIHREVLVLALEGMGYREIADVVGISESNVGVRLNRARERLRELLEHQS